MEGGEIAMGKRRGSGLREADAERQRQKHDRELGQAGRAVRDTIYQDEARKKEEAKRPKP